MITKVNSEDIIFLINGSVLSGLIMTLTNLQSPIQTFSVYAWLFILLIISTHLINNIIN